MLKKLIIAAVTTVCLWPAAASAMDGDLSVTLTGIDKADLSNDGSEALCALNVQVVNNTDNHLDELKAGIGDTPDFEFKDVVAHGNTSVRSVSYSHSCKYLLWQFRQAAAHQLRIQFARCAMEGMREGDCMNMVSVHADTDVTPEMAASVDAAMRILDQKFNECMTRNGNVEDYVHNAMCSNEAEGSK